MPVLRGADTREGRWVTLRSPLELPLARELERGLAAALDGAAHLIIDARQVPSADLAGVRVLDRLRRAADRSGARVSLMPSPSLRALLVACDGAWAALLDGAAPPTPPA